jgi:glycosyltransferase involved in cell wall biosynthesis
MKVMVVARTFDRMAGGVERMAICLMNAMVERGHEVDLFSWDQAGARAFYEMAPAITWHRLAMGDPAVRAGYTLILQRAWTIRALVRQRRPDIIICFQCGPFLSMRLYTLGLGIPVIAAERNAPSLFEHTRARRYRALIFQGLRLANTIVIQNERFHASYPAYLHKRIVTIPNPVFPASQQARPDSADHGRFRMLSVGRLSYQKNYTVLVKAFTDIAARFPDWDLVVIGDGEERPKLEMLIRDAGLENRILLPGTAENITEWYVKSHAFCLSSRWEGFPNALAEALAHGLPCVGYAGCAGVCDLVTNGRNGILAAGNNDVKSLSHALEKLMSMPELRKDYGRNASTSIKEYKPEKIFNLWELLFSKITNK